MQSTLDSYNPSSFLENSYNSNQDALAVDNGPSRAQSCLNLDQTQSQPQYDYDQDLVDLQTPPDMALSPLEVHRQQQPFVSNIKITDLPAEILEMVFKDVILEECDGNPANYYSAVEGLSRKLTVHSKFFSSGTPVLYKHVAFAHPHAFDRFLKSIVNTGFGRFTRALDFSGFTSVGLGRSGRMNEEIQMVTAATILKCLKLTPNLREFMATENIERDLDVNVFEQLYSMYDLESLDFCGATHALFVRGFAQSLGFTEVDGEYVRTTDPKLLEKYSSPLPKITRLSLHGCSTLPSNVIQALLERLPNLSRLDLTHTLTTYECLFSISTTCALDKLSISKCSHLKSEATAYFFANHPAVRSLSWLNMMFEGTRPSPISAQDADAIFKNLPPLEHLNIHGLPFTNLKPVIEMTGLKSLALGYSRLDVKQIKQILSQMPALEYVDLTGIPQIDHWVMQDQALLNANTNIQLIEFTRDILDKKLNHVNIPGFKIALGQGGRRGWLYRGDKVPTNKTLTTVAGTGASIISNSLEAETSNTPARPMFTFGSFAQNKLRAKQLQEEAARAALSAVLSPSPEVRPVNVLGMEMGSAVWKNACRKISTCLIGIGGNECEDAIKERGIYLYYGYRK